MKHELTPIIPIEFIFVFKIFLKKKKKKNKV